MTRRTITGTKQRVETIGYRWSNIVIRPHGLVRLRLARQRELITELDRAGHDTEEARAILNTLMEGPSRTRSRTSSRSRSRVVTGASRTSIAAKNLPARRQEDAKRWTFLW